MFRGNTRTGSGLFRVGLLAALVALASSFAAGPAQAWSPWKESEAFCTNLGRVNYHLYDLGVLPESYRAALTAAVADWNQKAPWLSITISDTKPAEQAGHGYLRNVLATQSAEHPTAFADVGPVKCFTNKAVYSTITSYTSMMDGRSAFGKEDTYVHELGHMLGLDHAGEVCRSVMYAHGSNCDWAGIGPYADDLAGSLDVNAPDYVRPFPAGSTIKQGQTTLSASTSRWWGSAFEAGDGSTAAERFTFVPAAPKQPWGKVVNMATGLCLNVKISWPLDDDDLQPHIVWDECSAKGGWFGIGLIANRDIRLVTPVLRRCVGSQKGWFGRTTMGLVDCSSSASVLTVSRPATRPGDTIRRVRRVSALASMHVVGQGSGRCLDVTDGVRTPGATVELWDCSDSAANQTWAEHDGALTVYSSDTDTGTTGLTSDDRDPGLCMQTSGSGDNTTIVTAACDGSAAQRWQMHGNGNVYNPVTNKCLAARNGGTAPGTPIVLYSCNTGTNEVFNIPDGISAPNASIRTLVNTGRVLTVDSNFGAVLTSGGDTDQWEYIPIPQQSFGWLYNTATGRCLSAPIISGPTVARACDESAASHWKASPNSDGSSSFVNVGVNQCLDLFGSKDADGAAIGVYGCSSAANQRWRILPGPSDHSAPEPSPTTPLNLALFGTATQSSTLDFASGGPATASRAIDGNTDGAFLNHSVTHTAADAGAWWLLNLNNSPTIHHITIHNRTDCCSTRLSRYWVITSESPIDGNASLAELTAKPGNVAYFRDASAAVTTIDTIVAPMRYILVKLEGTNNLSLAEVMVD